MNTKISDCRAFRKAGGEERGTSPSFVYILRCRDDTLYTGWTNDVARRLEAHNAGKGAKYTRGRGPVELVYLEALPTKEEPLRREREIKRLKRKEKQQLIEERQKAIEEERQKAAEEELRKAVEVEE